MKRNAWWKGLLFTVFALTIGLAPMLVQADMPRPVYTYYTLPKAEWQREMKRLADGGKVADKELGKDDLSSLYDRSNRTPLLQYVYIFFLAMSGIIIVVGCLDIKKCADKRKRIELAIGTALLSVFSLYVGFLIVPGRLSKIQAHSDYGVRTIGYDGMGRYHGHIAVAPRKGESYNQYKTRVMWKNSDCCEECGTKLEHWYDRGRHVACPKCNPGAGPSRRRGFGGEVDVGSSDNLCPKCGTKLEHWYDKGCHVACPKCNPDAIRRRESIMGYDEEAK